MSPGHGAALCLFDISEGVATQAIKRRWKDGNYGKAGERPRGEYVAGWLQMAGRKREGVN